MKKTILLIFLALILVGFYCSKKENEHAKQVIDDPYINEIQDWQVKRLERLKTKNGWLSLAGLFWLNEGKNTIGSVDSNDFIIESDTIPANLGTFVWEKDKVEFITDQKVTHQDQPVTNIELRDDSQGKPTLLAFNTFTWHLIKRGPKLGVRLRNSAHPRIEQLKVIPTYPIDKNWKIEANFIKFEEPRMFKVLNAAGVEEENESFGKLLFTINNQEHTLIPFGKGERGFFLVLADQTSGKETYGGGRFLSIPAPDEQGITYIDFNKAYNPPCVFSEYATCPFPIKENTLKISVTAGEKMVEGLVH